MEFNHDKPRVMHIDLNSCFATTEQQARPMLRGKPVAISNRTGANSAIITASYEAKALGVKVGTRRKEALAICPELVFIEAEPSKYRYVYRKLLGILNDYSAKVSMKSIDEGVIDFCEAPEVLKMRNLREIGQEIKQRLRDEVGCWMRCNVGIATNRFLAKTAAGLNKPDGMDEISPTNIHGVFEKLRLTDLTGIAEANAERLRAVGIFTPLEMLAASEEALTVAFKSVCGRQWYRRLRGWEVDDYESDIKSVGRQYVLESDNLTFEQIEQRLFHLAEEVGDKLRRKGRQARGVYVYVRTNRTPVGSHGRYWHRCKMSERSFRSNRAIWMVAKELFKEAPDDIREIGVTCYGISRAENEQMSIFYEEEKKEEQVMLAVDEVNERYGARTVHACETLGTRSVKAKIPFGSTRYL